MRSAPRGGRHELLRAVVMATGLLACSAVLAVVPSLSDPADTAAPEEVSVGEPPRAAAAARLASRLRAVATLRSAVVLISADRLLDADRLHDEAQRSAQEAARAAARRLSPRPQAPAVPPVSADPGACSGWLDLVDDYAWDVSTACSILACESGGDPNNVNPDSGAAGLMQHLPPPANWQDPRTNMDAAYSKYLARGWQPWSACL